MKICIMGTPARCSNRGVEALRAALVNLCLEVAPGAEMALLLSNRDDTPVSLRVKGDWREVPVVHARLSPWTHPRHFLPVILFMSALHRLAPNGVLKSAVEERVPWIKAVVQADLVGDIRGGDSFSDIYGVRSFLGGFFLAWTVILLRGRIVQLPQTFGPYISSLARLLARYLLERSTVIVARDKESQAVARDYVGPKREVLLSPDVAFALQTVRPVCIDLEPTADLSPPLDSSDAPVLAMAARRSSSRPVIGLNINGLMYFGGYTRKNMFGLTLDYPAFLHDLITALLQEHDGELWMIPHTYGAPGHVESDPDAGRRVRDQLTPAQRSRVRIVTREYDCHELKGLIGECGFFIGSRMHACIAALSQGIPCVGVAYSRKFLGVFETVGMQDWVVDGRTATAETAVARVLELYRQRDEVRTSLAERAEAARVELRAVFRRLVEDCASSRS